MVSLAGINGERADVIKWCLRNAEPGGEVAREIADAMAKFNPDLLPQHGRVEKVQAVLRTLEAKREVHRIRIGHTDYWSLRCSTS